jgi:hypothetical protein
MAIKIAVVAPPDVVNPYSAFKNKEQKEVLELFKAGAQLCVWRCSSPHNWYLETADGEQMPVNLDGYILGALRRLAKHSFKSPRLVTRGSRFENGLPEKECWQYDPQAAAVLEQRWAAFEAELAARAAIARQPAPALDKLSESALSLLRTLRTGACLHRYKELAKEFSELDQQGLLELTSYGKFRLTPTVARLRIPRGQSLRLA